MLARRLQPTHPRLLPKPRRLPARVPPVLPRDQVARAAEIALAVQMFKALAVHQPPERPRVLGHAPREQPANLVQQAAGQLPVDPVRDAGFELRHGQPQADRDHRVAGDRRARLGEVLGQRAAGQQQHLQRADQAFLVGGVNPARRRRVAAGEGPVQGAEAPAAGRPSQPAPERVVAPRPLEQPPGQRPIVETGAPGQYRQSTAASHRPHGPRRVAAVARRRVHLGRVDQIDQMMRNPPPPAGGDLVGPDVETPIDRRRIAGQDLAPDPRRERQREGTLARRRRSDDREQQRTPVRISKAAGPSHRPVR